MKEILYSGWINKWILIVHLLVLAGLIVDYGFDISERLEQVIITLYLIFLVTGLIRILLKYLFNRKDFILSVFFFDLLSTIFILFCIYKQLIYDGSKLITYWLKWAVILKLVRESMSISLRYKRSFLTPAQLFIISFLSLIFIGTLLLMLPNATHHGIPFIDALFTSTSAVCVTGLIVVDTSSYFTLFGQTLIIVLIQAGGLGILTFTSYFSYFFKGKSTYENQIALNEMTNSEKIGDVFKTVKRILWITFLVEAIGAFLIYINLDINLIPSFANRVYFSIFHSISAFCNAGFSILPNSMMETEYVSNYSLQFTIIVIFVFGGMGFPIVINSLRYFKYVIGRYVLWFIEGKNNYKAWILTLDNKINLITTISLILLGTIIIYIKEFNNVLSNHSGIGKVITALFTATTPRTAGFNSIDFSQLQFSSIIIIILLMWIGASPASTGGGIKTSTFAIAILNYLSLAKGRTKIEIFRREIADISLRRAFAVMTLSLLVIGSGIFLITYFDNYLSLLDIAFECFSAYSTVGLSLGITGSLSSASKFVLIGIMFIGRVSMLTILIAVFKKMKYSNYNYPLDEILIN